ncbi:AMP-dependent synthetase/ligase [Trema orientale]|uniref:AMP-dependent synthetase/ligase n=1 Tax=Trema orientale TaxID=63057 RepID=A0A2P5DRD4_TREOI|nr:AMP-dependent synthetase/ligase [Trema orientale]
MRQDGSSLREVVLRGGSVMLGYVKDSEGTTKSMSGDRWFYTGNVGVMHPDEYLEIRDRSKGHHHKRQGESEQCGGGVGAVRVLGYQ